MNTHTPGPWRIWRDMDPKEPLSIVGPSEDFTCTIAMENTQAQANARLIAAAPVRSYGTGRSPCKPFARSPINRYRNAQQAKHINPNENQTVFQAYCLRIVRRLQMAPTLPPSNA